MFVHSDGQLRAAYLILDYTPISKSYQVPKCVIKGKDPRLHRISVAVPSLLTTGSILEGIFTTDPIPEGIPKVALSFQHAAEEEATSSQPLTKGEEGIVEVSNSKDDFEVFNQPSLPEIPFGDLGHPLPAQTSQAQRDFPLPKDMGIQRKPRSTLQKLLESQPGGKAPGKVTQTRLPTPLPA